MINLLRRLFICRKRGHAPGPWMAEFCVVCKGPLPGKWS